MPAVRLVLDTNVVASGLLWDSGPPARLIDAARANEIELATSAPLIAELHRILGRAKFARQIAIAALSVDQLALGYASLATIVTPAEIGTVDIADPDDRLVLACALAAQPEAIVSGDPHLLNLKHYHRIPVLDPARALQIISA